MGVLVEGLTTEHESKAGAHPISGVEGLRGELDAIKAAGGDAVLDAKWLNTRSPMRTGYTAGDGQTLPRVLYPDALAAIRAGLVPVCSDADWLADPAKRGCFTLGDGSTTFRVPDYNGMSVGSLGAVLQRGDGLNSAGTDGIIQGDAIRNFAGEFGGIGGWSNRAYDLGITTGSGAFRKLNTGGYDLGDIKGVQIPHGETSSVMRFEVAFSGVPTAADNHPVNVTGCWAVRLFGAVQNAGSADAAALATAVADLAARMSVVEGKVAVLEQRKSTCLVNAVGTGAPHETVVAQLPANIAINTRYVLSNPFGITTPVECWPEILLNGMWSDPRFDSNAGSGGNGYGVGATYVQGIGVVVQTGRTGICVDSALTGGGHGVTGVTSSAPCRVFVRKLEA